MVVKCLIRQLRLEATCIKYFFVVRHEEISSVQEETEIVTIIQGFVSKPEFAKKK
jgi:hypothetical protein